VDAVVGPQFAAGAPLDATRGHKASTQFMLPQQGSIGFAYKLRSNWTLMADYQYVGWGAFHSVTVDFDAADNTTPDFTLTPDNKDTHGFRIGTEYQHSSKLTLRGGYLYHTAAEPTEFVTPLLPENDRNASPSASDTSLPRGSTPISPISTSSRTTAAAACSPKLWATPGSTASTHTWWASGWPTPSDRETERHASDHTRLRCGSSRPPAGRWRPAATTNSSTRRA